MASESELLELLKGKGVKALSEEFAKIDSVRHTNVHQVQKP